MKLLGIDTSGNTASVALCDGERIIAQTTVLTKLTHSQIILPLCKDVLRLANTELSEVDRIAVADGPGSYTGLRIGISAVKGMAFSLGTECVGVSTLEGLAYNLLGFEGRICPVMSARQDLVYTALFECDGKKMKRLTDDKIIAADELATSIDGKTFFTGDYAEEFCEKYKSENIVLAPPHLRLQLAGSLCFAAINKEAVSCDKLEARYLQRVKAEQDRLTEGKK